MPDLHEWLHRLLAGADEFGRPGLSGYSVLSRGPVCRPRTPSAAVCSFTPVPWGRAHLQGGGWWRRLNGNSLDPGA